MSDTSIKQNAEGCPEQTDQREAGQPAATGGEFEAPNYTQIPNKLFSLIPYMSDAELRVTLIIARETLGWHRKWSKEPGARDQSSVSGLSARGLMELTGLSKPTVKKGIKEGMERGTIQRKGAGDSFSYCLKIAAMTPPESGGADDDLAFDEESLANELGASGGSAEEADRGKDSLPGKNVTRQRNYPRRVNHLPPTGQKSLPEGGKNFAPHHEEEKKETNKTYTNTRAPASPARVVVGALSKFSLEECRRYAEHLFKTGQGITNPPGFARKINQTGEDDALIEEFLRPVIDVDACPDCQGRNFIHVDPSDFDKGVRKCGHEQAPLKIAS